MGWRASDTRQLFFKDMRIQATSMLGTPANGFKTFLKTLTSGRVSIGAISIGTALGAYERALAYSTERIAFGKPINNFQSVGFKLADMATKIEASKLLVFHAAWMKDQGLDITKEAAMAKLFASEVLGKETDQAIQIHGGMGLMDDLPIKRFWRDARVERIWDGTSEIQRHIISRDLLRALGA